MRALLKNAINIGRTAFLIRQNFKLSIENGNYDFVIWENPGIWCHADEINNIKRDLMTVAEKAQNGKEIPTYGVFSENNEPFKNVLITIIYSHTYREPVAFSAQVKFHLNIDSKDIDVVHTGLCYIVPEQRGKGLTRFLFLYSMMVRLLISRFRAVWVSSVSQVPSVIGVVAESLQNTFPDPLKQVKQTSMHKKIGIAIMQNHRESFGVADDCKYNEDTQVIEDSYVNTESFNLQKSFHEAMKHRDERVNAFCKEQLNYEVGDDFLQIGQVSISCVLIFLKQLIGNMINKFYVGLIQIKGSVQQNA